MLTALYGLLALLFVLGGVVYAYDARSYTGDQRTRAPRLVQAYLGSGLLLSVIGLASLAWIVGGGSVWVAGVLLPPSPCCRVSCSTDSTSSWRSIGVR